MRQCLLLPVILLLAACAPQPESPSVMRVEKPGGTYGVWLTNVDSDVLFSRAGIQDAVDFMAEHGINTVYPVVWNDAHTLYPSAVCQATLGYAIDPRMKDRDPLQEIIEAAHAQGIRVIPWFEYGFAASYRKDGGIILEKHPHWAARDSSGGLLTKNGFEWLNAYHPEVQAFLMGMIKEVVMNYDVDGIQGDDRLPASPVEGGYSEYTRKLYAADHAGAEPPRNPRDPAFKRWKADHLNAFGKRVYAEVKALKPDVLISWAPSIYPWSYDEYLQDWPEWIRGGYADEVIPQCYRYSFERYRQTLAALSADSLGISEEQQAMIIPGILMNVGDYRIPLDYLQQAVSENRQRGFTGEVHFFYEGLRKENDELATYLKTLYRTP